MLHMKFKDFMGKQDSQANIYTIAQSSSTVAIYISFSVFKLSF